MWFIKMECTWFLYNITYNDKITLSMFHLQWPKVVSKQWMEREPRPNTLSPHYPLYYSSPAIFATFSTQISTTAKSEGFLKGQSRTFCFKSQNNFETSETAKWLFSSFSSLCWFFWTQLGSATQWWDPHFQKNIPIGQVSSHPCKQVVLWARSVGCLLRALPANCPDGHFPCLSPTPPT